MSKEECKIEIKTYCAKCGEKVDSCISDMEGIYVTNTISIHVAPCKKCQR